MPEGGALTITTSVEPNGHVGLTVCDTGPGIEPALRERVFDPFFTTKAAGKGTGLGLAVVHGIVMRHGGTISICDAPGRGACVKIVLPRAELGDTAAAAPAISQEAGAASVIKKGIRILIVEDEQGAREALHGILSASGLEVASVATAEAALELPDSPGFDLLLTDYQLPDGLGDQLAQVLLQRWQELAIILMSGYAEDRLLRQAVRHGSIRFLQKPFPFAVLEREIVTALREQGITPG
jgi:two-component system cell cycle sensor histidine kinase/response regulator CckA